MKEIKLETLKEIEKEYLSEKCSAIARHALSNSDIQAVAASKDCVRAYKTCTECMHRIVI